MLPRAGAQVAVIERGERLLEPFDPDLVGWLMESFHGAGIDVRLKKSVTAIEKKGDEFVVHASSDDAEATFRADLVVHAAGRVADLDPLDLCRR